MTVSSTSSRVVYAGNDSTASFPFAFKVQQAADLVVVYTDLGGTDHVLSGAQYAASGLGLDAGGTVTYPLAGSPIAAGTRLTIYRDVALTQPTSISNQGAMWPSVIEAALDRLTFIAQKVSDQVSRALVIAPTDGASPGVLPNAAIRANSVLGFDGAGQPVAMTLGTTAIAWATWLVQNFAAQATSAADARTALGAIALADLAAGQTIASTGSYTLPGGLVVKWGTSGSIAGSGNATISFAAAFPNALFGAVLTPLANTGGYASNESTSGFRINNNGSNSATFFWIAFGN